jgi:hypothetical protein
MYYSSDETLSRRELEARSIKALIDCGTLQTVEDTEIPTTPSSDLPSRISIDNSDLSGAGDGDVIVTLELGLEIDKILGVEVYKKSTGELIEFLSEPEIDGTTIVFTISGGTITPEVPEDDPDPREPATVENTLQDGVVFYHYVLKQ